MFNHQKSTRMDLAALVRSAQSIRRKTVIVHGVNTLGILGSGTALALKNANPLIYTAYRDYVYDRSSGNPKFENSTLLGQVSLVELTPRVMVANLFSQGRIATYRGEVVASEKAILDGFQWILEFLRMKQPMIHPGLETDLYFPRIGCDRGGLDWNRVGASLEAQLNQHHDLVNPILVEWP